VSGVFCFLEVAMDSAIYSLAGVLISLLFSYVPRAREWFDAHSATEKRIVMLVFLAVATGAIYGGACMGLAQTVPCTREGALDLLRAFIAAVVANQAAYMLSPQTKSDEPDWAV
jgi:hypothetical protein